MFQENGSIEPMRISNLNKILVSKKKKKNQQGYHFTKGKIWPWHLKRTIPKTHMEIITNKKKVSCRLYPILSSKLLLYMKGEEKNNNNLRFNSSVECHLLTY